MTKKLIEVNEACIHINAIKQLNNRYQALFEYSNDAIIIHDLDGKILEVNKKAEAMFGRTKEEFYTLYTHHFPARDGERKCKKNIKIIQNKGFIRFECEFIRQDQTRFPVEVSASLIKTEETSLIQAIIKDLTIEKQALLEISKKNEELKTSEKKLVEAQQIAQVGNWELDLLNNELTWSDEVYRIFDLEVNEFEANYQAFLDTIHPEDVNKVNQAYMKSIEEKSSYSIIHRIITKNGTLKYVEEKCQHLTDEYNNIIRSIGTVQDISQRKKTEIELKKTQNDFQSILENMQDTYYRTNLKGELILISGGVEQLLGYKEEELLGKQLATLYRYPSLRESFLEDLHNNNGKYSIEAELIHKDQHFVWASTKSQYWYTDSGELGGVEGFVRNITSQKLAQINEQNLLNLIDASSNEIYVFDKKSLHFNYVNQGGLNNLQYSIDELSKIYPYDIKPEFDEPSFRAYIKPLMTQQVKKQNFKTTHQRKDGSTYPVQVHLQLLGDNFLAVIMDITEQEEMNQKIKEQEEIMLVQSRHAAMGEMISMIAHQWRQPISIVGMLANTTMQSIKMNYIDKDSMLDDLKNISDQVQYMSKTIDDFRNFFQKSNTIEEVNLYNILTESNNILGAVLRSHNISLNIDCKESIVLYTYSRELVQMIINILSNAKDALEKTSTKKSIFIHVLEKDQNVEISIFNNGSPIEESIKNKIFEPYFTTKRNFGGTGLGLYMVKSILEKHMDGNISVENRKDGVAFNITIPKVLKI